MSTIDRRSFLKSSVTALTATAVAGHNRLASAQNAAPKTGANNNIRVAVIGVNSQGNEHIRGYLGTPGFELVALCDIDEKVLNQRADEVENKVNRKIARFGDLRKLYEDKSIDAVSIATPNHWHTLASLWAMQAGKDVYVEKPLSHNIWEGRQLVKTARKYNRMCQHGTQGRSSDVIREAVQKLQNGIIGDVYLARALCYKWRPSIERAGGPQQPPAGVDYDIWLGPAPQKPVMRKKFHYDWHWFWDYGNGDIGNQGVHEMDLARWGLGVSLPKKVQSMGGKFLFDDDKETFNVQTASFFYPDQNKMLEFEVRPWITNTEGNFSAQPPNEVGVFFYGSEGYMTLQYFGYKTFMGKNREPGESHTGKENRWERFAKAIRSRKIEDLGVDVEEGHITSALCHLANISARLGRTLEFDAATEKFPNDADANKMLKREYRKPYEVPEEV